jgi:release factor glutamine methyltransferase
MMHAVPTAKKVLKRAERTLEASDAIEHPHAGKERYDAEELLSFVLGHEPSDDEPVKPKALKAFGKLLRRRVAGEPVPYITGTTTFLGLELAVRTGAFVPRESSEDTAQEAIRRLRGRARDGRRPVFVDLATGIGPIALAVAVKVPRSSVYGIDLYGKPVALASKNAARLGLTNVDFRQGDLFSPLPRKLRGKVDVITAHAPYVPRKEVADLPDEIRRFEPEESLTDYSTEGFGLMSRIAEEAPRWLRAGGWLIFEVSPDRSRGVAGLLRRNGYRQVRSIKGEIAVSRVIVGRA